MRYITFFFVLMTTNIYCQMDTAYIPFPTDSVAWNESGSQLINDNPYVVFSNNNFIFISGDTIIDNLVYAKVFEGREPFNINGTNTYYKGAIRENNKRVYFKEPNFPENIYYDFNLNIGDTLWHNYSPFGGWSVLTSIDSSQMMDGSFRRKYNFDDYNVFPSSVVEGIGNISTLGGGGILFPNGGFFFENYNQINCVFSPNELIYRREDLNTSYDCYKLHVSIQEVKKNLELIYPNPFKNNIIFKKEINNRNIIIYSITGKKIIEKPYFNGHILNLEELDKGIYFIKVIGNESYFTKIVKN